MEDTIYYTINKKNGEGKMFFSAKSIAFFMLGKHINEYILIKEDRVGVRIVESKRVDAYDLEQILLMS